MKFRGYLIAALWLSTWAAYGEEIEWSQKGAAWEDPTSWTGNKVPGPEDIAVFPLVTEPVKNQPQISGVATVGGLKFIQGEAGMAKESLWKIQAAVSKTQAPVNLDILGPDNGKTFPIWDIGGSGKLILGKLGVQITGVGGGPSFIRVPVSLSAMQDWCVGDPQEGGIGNLNGLDTGLTPRSSLVFTGELSGVGGFRKLGVGKVYYDNPVSPSFTGGVCVREGTVDWVLDKLTTPGKYSFGTGKLLLDGALFFLSPIRCSSLDCIPDLTNPITVTPRGGEIGCLAQRTNTPRDKFVPNIQISGPILLGGLLHFYDPLAVGDPETILLQSEITLDQSSSSTIGLTFNDGCSLIPSIDFKHKISDGAGEARNPLILWTMEGAFTISGRNDYAGGTLVTWCGSTVWGNCASFLAAVGVDPKASLGLGDLTIEPGGRIYLGSDSNLAPNREVHIHSNPLGLGVLSLGYNGLPPISSDSQGVIAIDTDKFDAISDLSKVGNGGMRLGSRDQGVFTGKSLLPGDGGVYRLGGGSVGGIPGRGWNTYPGLLHSGGDPGTYISANHWIRNKTLYSAQGVGQTVGAGRLTINEGVLTGKSIVEVGDYPFYGNTAVVLKGNNTFTGPLTVKGRAQFDFCSGMIQSRGSLLEGVTQTQAGASPFGSPSGTVLLDSSQWKLTGVPGGQPVSKGNTLFMGLAEIGLDANVDNPVSLTLARLERWGRGILTIDPWQESLQDKERLIVSDWNSDQTLLPPYYLYVSAKNWIGGWGEKGYVKNPEITTGPDFLTYDATGGKGFGRYTAYVTDLKTAKENDVVKTGAVALNGETCSVHGLRTTGDITGTGNLLIKGGGLILGGSISPSIDFGSLEGIIYTESLSPQPGLISEVLSGKISGSSGITFGAGPMTTANDWNLPQLKVVLSNRENDFKGQITICGASVVACFDTEDEKGVAHAGSLGDLNNPIELNGGALELLSQDHQNVEADGAGKVDYGNCLALTRTIYLGPAGGWIDPHTNPNMPVVIRSRITGLGFLSKLVEGCSRLTISNGGNDYSGGTWVSAYSGFTVTEKSKLGVGPVQVEPLGNLDLKGNGNIDSMARLTVAAHSFTRFESPTPKIGSLEGSGIIFLGQAKAGTTLTTGIDNSNTEFYGEVREATDSLPGALIKEGTGTFTLLGSHTYSGATTVEHGILNLKGNVVGDMVTHAEGTFEGSGRVGGSFVLDGGTLAVNLKGSELKALKVTGTAKLSGTLRVTLAESYSPSVGQKWTLIESEGGITGQFTQLPPGFKINMLAEGKKLELERVQ